MQHGAPLPTRQTVSPLAVDAVRSFLATGTFNYVLGTPRLAQHPQARYFGVSSSSGELVAVATRVEATAPQLPMLAVAVGPSCTSDELEQLLHVAAHDGAPSRLVTSLTWGDEPSREVLTKAGLALAGCASCDGISEVVLVVADDVAEPPNALGRRANIECDGKHPNRGPIG